MEFRIIALLLVLLALIFTFRPVQAAGVIYQDGQMVVTLNDEPCLNQKVLAYIDPKINGYFQAGAVIWQGQRFALCWASTDTGDVFIIDETGDRGVLPANRFKRMTGV